MIDLKVNETVLKKAVERARDRNIIIPTFEQMKHPEMIPGKIKDELKDIGLWDITSRNLFRITWKNEPVVKGGGFGKVNHIILPPELTGVKAKIVVIVGKWFPTGAHKVGAAFGCLVPKLTTGQFDPVNQQAVWPSTGNYCRGGAYDSALLGCQSIAILPEEMSKERFEWLKQVAGEVIATKGCESNVKEIYDKCWELRNTRKDNIVIFNQFDEYGNHLWHYHVTGHAMEEMVGYIMKDGDSLKAMVSSTGSAGTIAAGDYLKEKFPHMKTVASEALQCPTLLSNGFGGHRIEGIGDKHVPWIHNVRNTDFVVAIDDEDCMNLTRLFNEPAGKKYLESKGVDPELVKNLDLLGISGIANVLGAIKMAKYYEMTSEDVVIAIATDAMELYGSRLEELKEAHGEFNELNAGICFEHYLQGQKTDNMLELNYQDRKRVHNLKYYTWIEQQAKELDELNAQWYEKDFWKKIQNQVSDMDAKIEEFNDRVGLLKNYI